MSWPQGPVSVRHVVLLWSLSRRLMRAAGKNFRLTFLSCEGDNGLMDKIKLKWKTGAAPTGRYRSFDSRPWPSASYADSDRAAAYISCTRSYTPALARNPVLHDGTLLELAVLIADYTPIEGGGSFKWRTLKRRFNTLEAAKDAALAFLTANPSYHPPVDPSAK